MSVRHLHFRIHNRDPSCGQRPQWDRALPISDGGDDSDIGDDGRKRIPTSITTITVLTAITGNTLQSCL